MDYIDAIVTLVAGVQLFILYKLYSMSIRLARIEERIKWVIKMINSNDEPK